MVAWYFHCFSSAIIASQEGHHYAYHYSAGRHLVLARLLQMTHCRTAELELHMAHWRTAEGNFQEVREGAGAPLRDPLCAWRAGALLHAQRDLQNEDPPGYLAEGPKLGPLFANPHGPTSRS